MVHRKKKEGWFCVIGRRDCHTISAPLALPWLPCHFICHSHAMLFHAIATTGGDEVGGNKVECPKTATLSYGAWKKRNIKKLTKEGILRMKYFWLIRKIRYMNFGFFCIFDKIYNLQEF